MQPSTLRNYHQQQQQQQRHLFRVNGLFFFCSINCVLVLVFLLSHLASSSTQTVSAAASIHDLSVSNANTAPLPPDLPVAFSLQQQQQQQHFGGARHIASKRDLNVEDYDDEYNYDDVDYESQEAERRFSVNLVEEEEDSEEVDDECDDEYDYENVNDEEEAHHDEGSLREWMQSFQPDNYDEDDERSAFYVPEYARQYYYDRQHSGGPLPTPHVNGALTGGTVYNCTEGFHFHLQSPIRSTSILHLHFNIRLLLYLLISCS